MAGSCEVEDRSFDCRILLLHRPIQLRIDQPKLHILNQTLPLPGTHGLFHVNDDSRGLGTSVDSGPL